MNRIVHPGVAALAALLAAACVPTASALPLFARAESAPCSSCHTSAPQLNAYGTRYLLAGYRAPGGAGHTIAPAAPAASIVAEFGASLQRSDTLGSGGVRGARNTSEFRPYLLQLRSAGALSRAIAYGIEASVDSTAGDMRVPVLFAQFDRLAGGAVGVKAGRFETGLPFLSAVRRGTWAPFLAPVAIAAEGVELFAAHAAWAAAAGLINSDRTQAGAGANARSYSRLENTYLWATRSVAGQSAGARVLFARQASNISYHAWLQRLQVVLGGSLGTDRLRCEPAWVLDRFDDRPAAGIHLRHQYAVLQGLAVLDAAGATAMAFRLEHEHVTPTPFTRGEDRDLEALRLLRWVSPHARLAFEGSHAGDNLGGPHATRLDATVTLAY